MKKAFLFAVQVIIACNLFAQNTAAYNPHDLFVQNFNMPAANSFRSAKGVPGAAYWQNNSSYLIHATLSEKDTSVTGDVTITYTNNSPDQLDYLWLQLDQNVFASNSRSVAATPYPGDYFGVLNKPNGGYQIKDVTVSYGSQSYTVKPIISDTRMQVRLNTPMKAKGDKITLKINFSFAIPLDGAGRFGRQYTKDGVIYQIAQWYPRMCVYDDVEGWNTLPYMGLGEFYCDYGDYEYFITAPAEMIIYGSGDLQNAAEVLTPLQMKRLATAAGSDKTITIIGADEIGRPGTRPPTTTGNLTWHFTMKNCRDVAFAAGKGMIWDAARINLPSGKKAIAMSCYPVESMGDIAWSRSTEYLKHSIEIYSQNFFEYPWNVAVSNAGITGGMEYPGIIFNSYKEQKARLWFLISHEIGHNWFPMIVGSNERRYMWQDEGFNVYINYIANNLFNKGEYLVDPAYQDKSFFASRDIQFMDYKDPLMVVSDAMDPEQHYQYYGKTAYGLNLLRTVIVGKERFDYAFRKYTEAWAFKHPTPWDFFRCINNATGEDLNWFWKEWFFTTAKLDQTITAVNYVDGDPAKGALITIGNKGSLVLPVIMKIVQANGKTETVNLPADIWFRGGTWVYKYASAGKLVNITLDPDSQLPDSDRGNNEWKGN